MSADQATSVDTLASAVLSMATPNDIRRMCDSLVDAALAEAAWNHPGNPDDEDMVEA